jgi:m7GpppX diphosphatase
VRRPLAAEENMESKVTPIDILAGDQCKIHSLTVSDQHATLLISHAAKSDEVSPDGGESNEAEETKCNPVLSLLKMTVVPFHKSILGCNPVFTQEDIDNGQPPERNMLHHNEQASMSILSYLKGFDFELKSESGAEYSYYVAKPNGLQQMSTAAAAAENQQDSSDRDYGLHAAKSSAGSFDVELICPASSAQISRAMPTLGHVLIDETPEIYRTAVQPYIQSVVDGGSLSWITNIIELKKEKERLLFNNDDFVINVDTKWRTHPPPLTTPREKWLNDPSVDDLYCLAITKLSGIASLRDLRGEHIPMLQSMIREGLSAIKRIYGVNSNQIRIFIHYQPQFYHFHVHYTRLENEVGCCCERAHLLSDVIQNLQMDSDFYCKRTISYKLKKGAPLENIIGSYLSSKE